MQRPSGISLSDLFAICREDPASRWLWIRLYLRDLLARVVVPGLHGNRCREFAYGLGGRSPTASCRPLRLPGPAQRREIAMTWRVRPDCLCAPGDGLDGRLVGRSRGWSVRWARRLRRRTGQPTTATSWSNRRHN